MRDAVTDDPFRPAPGNEPLVFPGRDQESETAEGAESLAHIMLIGPRGNDRTALLRHFGKLAQGRANVAVVSGIHGRSPEKVLTSGLPTSFRTGVSLPRAGGVSYALGIPSLAALPEQCREAERELHDRQVTATA